MGVDTFIPQRTELRNTTTQPATVHAWYEAQVYAKVSGYLNDLRADIGQEVKAGDVLAVVNVPELAQQRQTKLASIKCLHADEQHAEAELSVAEAAIKASEAERELSKARTQAADAMREMARAMTEVARHELDELDVLLRYIQLTSPFDGVVTERNADLGDLVRNTQIGSSPHGTPLFTIVQLDKVRVRVAIPERDAPLVDIGDAARVTMQALPGQAFEGNISRVAGVMDEKTRTMLVEIGVPKDQRKLLPGMFGQATIVLEHSQDSIVLPSNALRFDEQGNSYVYTVNEESEIEIVDVETGLDDGNQVEILGGLDGSERIVGPMLRSLAEGQKVRVNAS